VVPVEVWEPDWLPDWPELAWPPDWLEPSWDWAKAIPEASKAAKVAVIRREEESCMSRPPGLFQLGRCWRPMREYTPAQRKDTESLYGRMRMAAGRFLAQLWSLPTKQKSDNPPKSKRVKAANQVKDDVGASLRRRTGHKGRGGQRGG
jgi:hypothetical protein